MADQLVPTSKQLIVIDNGSTFAAYQVALLAEKQYIDSAVAKSDAGEIVENDQENAFFIDSTHRQLHKAVKKAGRAALLVVATGVYSTITPAAQ